jgi:hypothetical protein
MRSSANGSNAARPSSRPSATPRAITAWIAAGWAAAAVTRCMRCCAQPASTSAAAAGHCRQGAAGLFAGPVAMDTVATMGRIGLAAHVIRARGTDPAVRITHASGVGNDVHSVRMNFAGPTRYPDSAPSTQVYVLKSIEQRVFCLADAARELRSSTRRWSASGGQKIPLD